MFHCKVNHLRDSVEMTTKIDISADLMQLAVFAEREDWLYQTELRLAGEFSRVALAFAEATPGAEVICTPVPPLFLYYFERLFSVVTQPRGAGCGVAG